LLKDRQESRVKLQLESFEDNLRSDLGVDYRKLRELLAAEKWSEADRETLAVMLKAAQTQEDWLDRPDIKTFP
jgi:serine/threonine-protein kinase